MHTPWHQMKRSLEAQESAMAQHYKNQIQDLRENFQRQMQLKNENQALLQKKVDFMSKELKRIREHKMGKQDHSECRLRLKAKERALRISENGRRYWMDHIAHRNKQCNKISGSIGTLQRMLDHRTKRMENAVQIANRIHSEYQMIRRHCRCGSVRRDGLDKLKAMERMVMEKNVVMGQCLYYLFGDERDEQKEGEPEVSGYESDAEDDISPQMKCE